MRENLAPLETLTAMIEHGWGGVRRDKIPEDWETRPGPEFEHAKKGRKFLVPAGLEERRNVSTAVEVLQSSGPAQRKTTPEATACARGESA